MNVDWNSMSDIQAHPDAQPLPLGTAARARIIAARARTLLDSAQLIDDERVRIEGSLRAAEARLKGGTLTRPGVRRTEILEGAARDVATVWMRVYGAPPWGRRPLLLSWIDRFWY
jgi:DNA-directed RNA polymerase subunit K/omega